MWAAAVLRSPCLRRTIQANVYTPCYIGGTLCYMKSFGVRELRQNATDVLREVASGETVIITNNGHPVAQLVEGSRELAAERFDHRVQVDQGDEFGELATSYNRMAEQLQASEERKAEALRQLAVTLNHDLNNAMATIEMQLSLLGRQSGGNSNLERYCREIQSTLARMSKTVASLKHIRRVVLTDYVDGQKMVDLERSVDAGEVRASDSTADAHTTGTK